MKDILNVIFAKADWMKTIVGLVFLSVFSFSAIYILKMPVPEGNREIAHFMLGEIAGVALTIASYYFGSSKGSQDKTEMMKKQNDIK
jgi:ABC-type Mn2+/Zn2+ transport system permease subunit